MTRSDRIRYMRFLLFLGLAISSLSCGTTKTDQRVDLPVPDPQTHRRVKPQSPQGKIARHDLIAALRLGPQKFIASVYVKPFLNGNRFLGFEILALFPDDPRFANARIKKGDVIISVNGHRLERPNQFMVAWSKMKQAREIRVQLLRNMRKRTVVYKIVDQ